MDGKHHSLFSAVFLWGVDLSVAWKKLASYPWFQCLDFHQLRILRLLISFSPQPQVIHFLSECGWSWTGEPSDKSHELHLMRHSMRR